MKVDMYIRRMARWNGTSKLVEYISEYLVGKNHKVRILCNRVDSENWLDRDIEVTTLPKNPIKGFLKVKELYSRSAPDVVHSHDNLGYLAELTGVPHISTSHSNWPRSWLMSVKHFAAGFIKEIPQDILLRLSDLPVAVSRFSKKQLESRMIYPKLCYNGVKVPDEYEFSDNKKILYLGTVDNRKAKYLASICEIIANNCSGADINVVGKISSESIAEKLAGIENVTVYGEVEAVEPFFKESSLLIFPSRAEACPLTVLEAQAWGLPVVAFNICSNNEIIEDGYTGTTVPPYDVEEFANSAVDQLKSYNQKTATDCRKWIKSSFNVKSMGKNYECMYEKIYNRNS